jgi:DNA-binding CsgD family transcriptional regulator
MAIDHPPESAFREALEARGFWRSAVLNDPELGFLMLEESGMVLSVNDNAGDILAATTADLMVGRRLHDLLDERIASERLGFVRYVLGTERSLLVTSIFRGVRCRCVFRRLPGDAGSSGHVLWTTRRAPIPWQPPDLHAMIDVVEAEAKDWGPLGALTPAERRLFSFYASGLSPSEAAARAEMPQDQAMQAQRNIFGKLHTKSPAKLAQYAVAAGLVQPEPFEAEGE